LLSSMMRTTGADAEPLHLVLVESALELVPREIWHHHVVRAHARKRGKKPWEMLLDISLHYFAMQSLPERHKRGRPDIVHVCLLNALSSPLNSEGLLRTVVHTVDNRAIFIDPETRIPRNYNRFVGLMEQLLTQGKVPPDSEKPLMYWRRMELRELLDELGIEVAILLSERGIKVELAELGRMLARAIKLGIPTAVMVGAFPHGDFRRETVDCATHIIAIYRRTLDAWTVVSRILTAVEMALNIV